MSTLSIRHAIMEALDLLEREQESIGRPMVEALASRLRLRDIFLSAAECPEHVYAPPKALEPWEVGIAILPAIKETHGLGTPVDESFSVKLQRKLASTVPPRPIVQLSFDDAFGHLSRLFNDGREVVTVLQYTNSQCLLVRREWPKTPPAATRGKVLTPITDLCISIPGKEAAAARLRAKPSSGLLIRCHGNARVYEHPTDSR